VSREPNIVISQEDYVLFPLGLPGVLGPGAYQCLTFTVGGVGLARYNQLNRPFPIREKPQQT
jgi:hypothetical protein